MGAKKNVLVLRKQKKLETVSCAHYVYPPLPHLPNPFSLETFIGGAQSGLGSNNSDLNLLRYTLPSCNASTYQV